MKTKHPQKTSKSEISRKVFNIVCSPIPSLKGGFVRSLTLLFFFGGGVGNCSSSIVQYGYLTLNRE